MNEAFWDQRYSEAKLAYGEGPNVFLAKVVQNVLQTEKDKPISVLCLAEGQGRNALYLAKYFPSSTVIAVDYSAVGVQCINSLAEKEGVKDRLTAYVADLANYDMLQHCPQKYDLIISIFAHTPSPIRKRVHSALADSLKPNGYFVLQGYTPANIGRGTGGPQAPDFCMTKDGLLSEIQGLEVKECEEKETHISEGQYHDGMAAVVQGIWKKL